MKYRTAEQLEEIFTSIIVGQKPQAAQFILLYEFDILSLRSAYESSDHDIDPDMIWSLAYASERAVLLNHA